MTSSNPTLPATITNGTLLADADPTVGETVGAVTLSGGTIAGSGSVVSITPASAGGVVMPAENTTAPTTLTTTTTNDQAWSPSTTFNVVLNDTIPGDFSTLNVNGNLNLNGASLGGFVGPGVVGGDIYVIMQEVGSGTISGTFAQPYGVEPPTLPDGTPNPDAGLGIAFVGGQKFDVLYTGTQVILTRVIALANLTLTSSTAKSTLSGVTNTSVYGQGVTITASVTPEHGAGTLTPQATVTFYLDSATSSNPSLTVTLVNGKATFDPQNFYGQFLSVGSHTISATFNGDSTFAPLPADGLPSDAPSIIQTVTQASTAVSMATSPNNPIPGQAVTVTATFTPVKPGAGVPTGTATFTVDGIMPSNGVVTLNPAGQAILVLNSLTASTHRIRVSYAGDTNFKGVASTSDTLISVVKGPATIQLAGSPISSQFGETVTFTATISGPVTPSGTVTFYNGSLVTSNIIANNVPLDPTGTATFTISTLSAGVHNILAAYSGNTSYNPTNNALSPFQYTVAPDDTAIALTASPNPVAFGALLTLAATVQVQAPGTGTPNGTVSFMEGTRVLGTPCSIRQAWRTSSSTR